MWANDCLDDGRDGHSVGSKVRVKGIWRQYLSFFLFPLTLLHGKLFILLHQTASICSSLSLSVMNETKRRTLEGKGKEPASPSLSSLTCSHFHANIHSFPSHSITCNNKSITVRFSCGFVISIQIIPLLLLGSLPTRTQWSVTQGSECYSIPILLPSPHLLLHFLSVSLALPHLDPGSQLTHSNQLQIRRVNLSAKPKMHLGAFLEFRAVFMAHIYTSDSQSFCDKERQISADGTGWWIVKLFNFVLLAYR